MPSSNTQQGNPKLRPRHDVSFYLALIFVVVPLWSTVPFAWAFVIYSLYTGRLWAYTWQGKCFFIVTLAEVFFSVYHYQLARFVAAQPPLPPGALHELRIAHSRVLKSGLASLPEDGFDEETTDSSRPCSPAEDITQLTHDDPRAVDFREVLRTWFGHAPWSEIRAVEVKRWLYWAIFNSHLPEPEKIPSSHHAVLDEALDLLQKRAGVVIPEGSAPMYRPLLLTLDQVTIHWRPFAFYAAVGLTNRLLKAWLQRYRQVQFVVHDGLDFLLRRPINWSPTHGPPPIVFIHGLGLGQLQYHLFITRLLDEFPDRPILILLQPHISQDIFHPRFLTPMSRHETSTRLAALLTKLGWVATDDVAAADSDDDDDAKSIATSLMDTGARGITMLSHSNGSYCHAWMLKMYPEMVSRSCFVDPVTFCSWEGDVCYNFIYRPCRTGIELLMRYFVAAELGVANLLQRHFDWSSNALWYEEIPNARDPNKTFFLIAAKDEIVNSKRVERYLRLHGVRKPLRVDPDGHHGTALIAGGAGHAAIFEWLREAD
ncbi:hypothetical protein HGRIS_009534 [Hohenbuehelia grisea]|uniref:Uncharacterized protein n=1 Tax=Hohenbuehelia grisea TaxID=104357 RepID=A0ABR3J1V9_9AGAR